MKLLAQIDDSYFLNISKNHFELKHQNWSDEGLSKKGNFQINSGSCKETGYSFRAPFCISQQLQKKKKNIGLKNKNEDF